MYEDMRKRPTNSYARFGLANPISLAPNEEKPEGDRYLPPDVRVLTQIMLAELSYFKVRNDVRTNAAPVVVASIHFKQMHFCIVRNSC